MLCGWARTLRFGQFRRVLAYWESRADPDGSEESAKDKHARRDAYLAQSFEGMFLGRMVLDPMSGTILKETWSAIEDEFFQADWAEAKAALGRDPLLTELPRTPAQRRADALVEMAIRARTAPPGGRRPAPLFSVLVDWPTLAGRICELASGLPITPGTLLPWLDQAYLERAVWGPEGRIEVSRTARFFTGATRRAIELRDRQCTHPFCDRPADECEVDHIVPWEAGGETTQENGRLRCGVHNRMRNGSGRREMQRWKAEQAAAEAEAQEADARWDPYDWEGEGPEPGG
jgi:hypothetical protein